MLPVKTNHLVTLGSACVITLMNFNIEKLNRYYDKAYHTHIAAQREFLSLIGICFIRPPSCLFAAGMK